MEGIPENFIRKESAFELGIIGYILGLWIAFRIQPFIARQLIGFAARFRNILWRITKVSWILPYNHLMEHGKIYSRLFS